MSTHTIRDLTIELIDEPKQRHVVAWEKVARRLRNDDAKPELNRAFEAIKKLSIAENKPDVFVAAYRTIAEALEKAIEVLNNNEVLTVSANHSVMVKAAIESGWIVAPVMQLDDVDNMPPWQVTWIAERVGELYLQVTQVPKN